MAIESRESIPLKRLWSEVIPYLVEGRPWDLVHTVYSAGEVRKIIDSDREAGFLEPDRVSIANKLVTAAVILHDVGNSVVEDSATRWDDFSLRVKHMREGAKLASRVLNRVGGDSKEEVRIIALLVGTHDALYIKDEDLSEVDEGKSWERWWDEVRNDAWLGELARLVREADQVWPLHNDSFWKDVHFKVGTGKGYLNERDALDDWGNEFAGRMQTSYGMNLVRGQITDRMREISGVEPHESYEQLLEKWQRVNQEAVEDPVGWVNTNLGG